MNRRSFILRSITATAALVAAPSIVLATPEPPADPFEILSPDEIKAWLGNNRYVATPCFRYFHYPAVIQGKNGLELDSGTPYAVKTWRLKMCADLDYIAGKGNFKSARLLAKQTAITEITRLGLTHVHSVRFCESPIVAIPDGYPRFHCAFVRGARVKAL